LAEQTWKDGRLGFHHSLRDVFICCVFAAKLSNVCIGPSFTGLDALWMFRFRVHSCCQLSGCFGSRCTAIVSSLDGFCSGCTAIVSSLDGFCSGCTAAVSSLDGFCSSCTAAVSCLDVLLLLSLFGCSSPGCVVCKQDALAQSLQLTSTHLLL
jgi:hypothetical protein